MKKFLLEFLDFVPCVTVLLLAITLTSHLAFHAPKPPTPAYVTVYMDFESKIAALESRILVLENNVRVTHLRFERIEQFERSSNGGIILTKP